MAKNTDGTPSAAAAAVLQEQVLALPVVCLATANFDLTVRDVVKGKATVIGKCSRKAR